MKILQNNYSCIVIFASFVDYIDKVKKGMLNNDESIYENCKRCSRKWNEFK